LKVGVILGDGSLRNKTNSDIKSFLLKDKFVLNLLQKFPSSHGIELHIVKKSSPFNLPVLTNGNGFDFSFSIECSNGREFSKGISVRYLSTDKKAREIAEIFQQNIVL
jgi:tRNA A37 threonylcarbamoyltransferase TsaD